VLALRIRPRRKIFADCSISHGAAFAAWFVNRSTYGVVRVVADQANAGETAAIKAALRYSAGPVVVLTDHEVLAYSIKDPNSFTYKRLVVADPSLPALRAELIRRNSQLRFVRGHGAASPPQMKFVDALSRAVSRRFSTLDLELGDELVSTGALPLAISPKVILPNCPVNRDLTTHLNKHVRPLLGRRPKRSVRRALEEAYVSQLPPKVPLKERRRAVKQAALAL
jgi:hypothetical protein